MVLFNYSTKELTAKVVYYGPGLCGKTTNLQYIHENLPDTVRGKMLSLATKTDRTLFFDFLPIDLGEIRGMQTRVQLYTVPGQVFYNETRKLVLKGADGIVFVADSQEQMLRANAESFKNLEDNLKAHGLELANMPHVIQFNKRDLPKLSSLDDMNATINKYNAPFFESVATTGIGVQDGLKAITKLVLLHLTQKYDPKATAAEAQAKAAAPQPSAPAPAVQAPPPIASVGGEAAVPAAGMALGEAAASTGIPLSGSTPPPPVMAVPATGETTPMFGDADIDGLVDEVQEAATPMVALDLEAPATPEVAAAAVDASPGAPATGPSFEIDHQLDDPPAVEAVLPDLSAAPAVDAPPEQPATLSELSNDRDLFEDPGLDVARLSRGEEQEIEIPIELADGDAVRRYKLALRVRMDPVD